MQQIILLMRPCSFTFRTGTIHAVIDKSVAAPACVGAPRGDLRQARGFAQNSLNLLDLDCIRVSNAAPRKLKKPHSIAVNSREADLTSICRR